MRLFPKKTSQRSTPARRTLEAAVARRASTRSPAIEEEDEPTTSFKTALIVVLLLHLVAGGGILMFDQIKTRRLGSMEATAPVKKASLPVVAAPAADHPKTAAAPVETARKNAPTTTTTASAAPAPSAAPTTPAKSTATSTTPPASAVRSPSPIAEGKKTPTYYTVAKGDKLAIIAKKLHVNSDDLLKLNKIDDPKKLRIGQKLQIPAKTRSASN